MNTVSKEEDIFKKDVTQPKSQILALKDKHISNSSK